MGTGRFKNGKFDITAIANFAMTMNDWTEWERCFKKVSEILYNASEGQMSFGNIFVCDESIGLDTADFILYQAGDPSYSSGTFGNPGSAVHLMPYVKRQILTIIHEMGHHVWGLGDEYCAPYVYENIDHTNPSINNRTIPILNSGRVDDELSTQNAQALLMFGGLYERRNIIADTATSITVDLDYPDLPTNADDDWVLIQIPAECSNVANSNYCVMEKSRNAAGSFDLAGNWTDAAHPVTEFCSAINHDPDNDTAQENSHGQSCWETIIERAEFTTLAVPNPASGVLPAGNVEPNWFALDKQSRFALVLDRSGSMASGHKMSDAQYGAIYWLEFCAQGNDLLTIIWYDHIIDNILDLTEVSTLAGLDDEIDAINLLTPRGSTNIRDGLYEALHQIQTPATRAAVQATLLLTDGKHNTPSGSEASEVLPSFNEEGVRIYTLGVGAPDAVDMDALDELAEETGGNSYAVGDDEPGFIEAAMVEINAEVRGGIITTSPESFPDSRKTESDALIKKILSLGQEKRVNLKEICEVLGIKDEKDLIYPPKKLKSVLSSIPADVEEKCDRVSFSLIYPKGSTLWLYLLDPNGNFIDMNSSSVNHVISTAPHEFAIIKKPKPGRWHMIAVRAETGIAFKFRAIAGGENKNIQAFGGASTNNCLKAPVRLYASARFKNDISGLHITATIISPKGTKKYITLDDNKYGEPNSGEYEGFVTVDYPGRYHGTIRIENTGKAMTAKPARRILDSQKGKIETDKDIPKFVRVIPFYFDSGKRVEIKDTERENGIHKIYGNIKERQTKMISAKLKRKK